MARIPNMNPAIVIIPTYNEKDNIALIIEAVLALSVHFDLLIIDDNSPDGTANIVKALQHTHNTEENTRITLLQREKKLGLGTAYIMGFKYAIKQGYSFILEMDADFSHNPKDLVRLYQACSKQDFDVSIGSRYATGVNVVNWSIKRVLLSYFANFYVRKITRMHLRDATAGFVCYRKEVLEKVPLDQVKLIGYAFQIEMKFLAWKYGFNIVEVPIIFTERKRGESKLSVGIFKEAFFGVLLLSLRSCFKTYGTAGKIHIQPCQEEDEN